MKNLFLTSYFAGTAELFQNYFEGRTVKRKVLFVPTAGKVEEYNLYVEEAMNAFEALEFEIDVLDVSAIDEKAAKEKISDTECLYISGGNTFYLLQELKKKHLIGVIRGKINEGMIYIGESAGAIIASPSIEYNQIMDDKSIATELSSYDALGVVDFYVLPHYNEFPFEETADKTKEVYGKELRLLPINNSEAVIVSGDTYKVIKNRC